VTPATLNLSCVRLVDTFPLVLALVPLFGPLSLRLGDDEIVVDGTKDDLDLEFELERRRRPVIKISLG
jgi:hypothetical protein